MNCPHHIRIFASQPRSYRDLPLRLAEFGTVYRWEQSGEISGMTRVRGFTQDDAHLFVTEEQIEDELLGCIELVKVIFGTLGMKDYRVRIGLRDPNSDKYVGNSEKSLIHRLYGAGHPRLVFELDTYLNNQPSHHRVDRDLSLIHI